MKYLIAAAIVSTLFLFGVLALSTNKHPDYLDPELSQEMDRLREAQNKQNLENPGLGGVTSAQINEERMIASKTVWASFDFSKPSILRSAINLGPISAIIRLAERWRIPDDPEFSLQKYRYELDAKVKPEDWYRFKNVRSKAEFDSLVRDVNKEYEDQNIIKYASGGMFLYGITWFVPLLLFPIFPFLWLVRHMKNGQGICRSRSHSGHKPGAVPQDNGR